MAQDAANTHHETERGLSCMKRLFSLLVAMLMLISCVAFAEEAAEEVIPPPNPVDAKIVTKVIDEGQIINGVRIEFDGEWTTGTLTTSSFTVNGFSVVQLYINNSGRPGEAEYTGKYVFAMFDEPMGIGGGTYGTLQYSMDTGTNSAPRDLTLNISYNSTIIDAKGYVHAEVDDFIEGSVTDDNGYTTNYRLFVPEDKEATLPLVIWLHGAGERGDNNFTQIAANRGALNYATLDSQAEHPCYVLAPQAHAKTEEDNGGWNEPAVANIGTIVKNLLAEYPIDASRIYVTGCSMGGMGTKSMMKAFPDMVAAAVVIANGSFLEDETELATVKDIPTIIITGAADSKGEADNTMVANHKLVTDLGYKAVAFLTERGRNGYLRGEAAARDLKPVIDEMTETGSIWAYVTYLADTVVPSAHWSWMAASENETLHDWMFAQVKAVPFGG